MIQVTPQTRILLAVEPADFRNGIDGLARECREVLQSDPFAGTVFVFRNRRGTAVKLLFYDGQGFWLCQKRLSSGRFRWWPKEGESGRRQLAMHELQLLLWNGNPSRAGASPPWRPLAMAA
ncbi:MAG: IS66 family insertion sequence element accessory protein TnpB [Phycisphaerae bacterium]|jgi:transposase